MLDDCILFIDDDAIVIDKPAGLPVDTASGAGESVVSRADELRRGNESPPVPLHRIDAESSGCLLLARRKEARVALQHALENDAVIRYFLAVVDTEVEEEGGTIDLRLAKHSPPQAGWRMVVDPKGEQAVTDWVRLKVRDGRTLIRFEPKTSRTHQLRVHAREAFGAGIVGDPVYGTGDGPMLLHASRLSLAKDPTSMKFDVHADAPLPEHFGPWRIDPAAVERDRQALRDSFTYRDITRDTDMGLEDLDRPIFDEANYGGYGPYWSFEPFVIDCYFEKGALEPLIKRYSGYKYPVGTGLDRILAALAEAKRAELMEKLWASVTRRTRAAFYGFKPGGSVSDQEWADKAKAEALQAFGDAIEWLTRVGASDAAQRMEQERSALSEGRRPELPPVTEQRRMDDALFWELIRQSRADAVELPDQIAQLETILLSLKEADIKKFAGIYARHMKQLYHWNVWALAYAARGGCSDDAFMEFRTWMILQGDPELLDLAVKDPASAAARVPKDPELPDGTLLPTIDDVHLARSGTSFEWPITDLDEPKGREWPEDEFDARFPELVGHYAS